MPTFKYKVPLEGQPDQIVGCEMFSREDLANIPNQRGGLFFRVVESGVFKDYAVPLVDTTDVRASRIRVKKASGTYALSKGDYTEGTQWVEKDRALHLSYHGVAHKELRSPPDASGYNVRVTLYEDAPDSIFEGAGAGGFKFYRAPSASGSYEVCKGGGMLWNWHSNRTTVFHFYVSDDFYVYGNSINDGYIKVEVLE